MTARPGRLVLLGHPVGHSLSPLFQNAALRRAGIPLIYEALDVEPTSLERTVRQLVLDRAAGNITIPHKEAFASLCDRRTSLAERAGAVNTFWVGEDGALWGDNTDAGGFEHMVREALGALPVKSRVAVIGAGGAATAVLAAVERWEGARVALANRTRTRGGALAQRFPVIARVDTDPADAARDATLVVNTTPIGLRDEGHPVPLDAVPREAALFDLVYRGSGTTTPWVREARARGRIASDGLPMLLEQGALAFERWLGMAAPRDAMREALRELSG